MNMKPHHCTFLIAAILLLSGGLMSFPAWCDMVSTTQANIVNGVNPCGPANPCGPGRTPVQVQAVNEECPAHACDVEVFTVPVGMRLVITRVGMFTQLNPRDNDGLVTMTVGFDGTSQLIALGTTSSMGEGANAYDAYGSETSIYAQGGSGVTCHIQGATTQVAGGLACSITGYLELTPAP
jgi:hypothetical protein